MKILLLGPIHRGKEFLQQQESLPFLKDQAHQSYVEALTELGHTVGVFRYTDTYLIPNAIRVTLTDWLQQHFPILKAKTQKLLDLFPHFIPENILKNYFLFLKAQKIKPDLILFSGGTSSIFSQTLIKIKSQFHCPVFLLWGINPDISATKIEKEMVYNGIIDIVVENDCGYAARWEKIGAKKTIVLPISSINPQMHTKIQFSETDKQTYSSDVCFVGSLSGNRQKILSELTGFNLKIWGDLLPGTVLMNSLKPFYFGTAHGENMVKAFNGAKIVLNFQPQDMICGGNMRSFEIPGCAAFQLVDKIDSRWFILNREVVVFSDVADLKKKISYYLQHSDKRITIANAGFKKAHAEHTYAVHFEKLLKMI